MEENIFEFCNTELDIFRFTIQFWKIIFIVIEEILLITSFENLIDEIFSKY